MRTGAISVTVLASLVLACGSEVQQHQASITGSSFTQPPGTVAVNLSVDDRENRVYGVGDLAWKGSFVYDSNTRTLSYDPFWSAGVPGWPVLYDDGPWTEGGHEPIGSRARDHVWGVTVFVSPPADGSTVYEYGLIDVLYETTLGNGWMWKGPNGSFTVTAGATEAVTAPGMAFPKFGHVDLQFVLDTTQLAQIPNPPGAWDTSTVTVKSSAWGWAELPMTGVGGGQYALKLSDVTGKHGVLVHTGLLSPGDAPEFVFVLGGYEYRDYWVDYGAYSDGVTVLTRGPGAPHWAPADIWRADNLNTAITVPGKSHQND